MYVMDLINETFSTELWYYILTAGNSNQDACMLLILVDFFGVLHHAFSSLNALSRDWVDNFGRGLREDQE